MKFYDWLETQRSASNEFGELARMLWGAGALQDLRKYGNSSLQCLIGVALRAAEKSGPDGDESMRRGLAATRACRLAYEEWIRCGAAAERFAPQGETQDAPRSGT